MVDQPAFAQCYGRSNVVFRHLDVFVNSRGMLFKKPKARYNFTQNYSLDKEDVDDASLVEAVNAALANDRD